MTMPTPLSSTPPRARLTRCALAVAGTLALGACTALQSLHVGGCNMIHDLGPLSACTALRSLDLSGCLLLDDLSPLAACSAPISDIPGQDQNLKDCLQSRHP